MCKTCYKWIKRFSKDGEVSQDDLCSARTMLELSAELLQSNTYKLMIEDIKKVKAENKSRTAWRIDGTLREFPKFEPIDLWFDYPIHRIDDTNILKDLSAESDTHSWKSKPKNSLLVAGTKCAKKII